MTSSTDKPKPEAATPADVQDDPAAILQAAIAAALRTDGDPNRDRQNTAETADTRGSSTNIHPHPSSPSFGKVRSTQDYFVTDEPLVRRCDPAFGIGFEFF